MALQTLTVTLLKPLLQGCTRDSRQLSQGMLHLGMATQWATWTHRYKGLNVEIAKHLAAAAELRHFSGLASSQDSQATEMAIHMLWHLGESFLLPCVCLCSCHQLLASGALF
jgi:hypothetical protein